MNRLELQIMQISATAAIDRRWRDDMCPRCRKRLVAIGTHDHYVCAAGHQFTAKQLGQWPAEE